MENNDKHPNGCKCMMCGAKDHPEGCRCMLCRGYGMMHSGMCGWCSRGKHWLLRFFVLLFAALFIFWIGVKLGELKSAVLQDSGYYLGSSMAGRSWYGNYMNGMMQPGSWGNYGYGPGMMRGWYGSQQSSTTAR